MIGAQNLHEAWLSSRLYSSGTPAGKWEETTLEAGEGGHLAWHMEIKTKQKEVCGGEGTLPQINKIEEWTPAPEAVL